jgi:hypothetical protein
VPRATFNTVASGVLLRLVFQSPGCRKWQPRVFDVANNLRARSSGLHLPSIERPFASRAHGYP